MAIYNQSDETNLHFERDTTLFAYLYSPRIEHGFTNVKSDFAWKCFGSLLHFFCKQDSFQSLIAV